MQSIEIWKDVIGFEGLYKVSNLGNVKSNKKQLKPGKSTNGYLFVNLYKNKKIFTQRVHVLVAQSFLNHICDKQNIVVDHINNNKFDNNLSNLQIINQRENTNKNMKIGKSGIRGVTWGIINKKWQVRVRVHNIKIHIKYFDCKEQAGKCYLEITDIIEKCKSKLTLDEIKELIKVYKLKIKEHGKNTNT